jgi:hypothetical protein
MKRFFALVLLIITIICLFSGCGWNKQIIDLNYNYDTAIIELPNGTVETVAVKKWNDYEGDQIQVVSKDGTVYLVHSSDCVLIDY